jgi:glycine/D-amino acid oxidase-like deaminating enzyme
MLSPITGKVIAELVIKGEVPELVRPFSLERFKQPIETVELESEW